MLIKTNTAAQELRRVNNVKLASEIRLQNNIIYIYAAAAIGCCRPDGMPDEGIRNCKFHQRRTSIAHLPPPHPLLARRLSSRSATATVAEAVDRRWRHNEENETCVR